MSGKQSLQGGKPLRFYTLLTFSHFSSDAEFQNKRPLLFCHFHLDLVLHKPSPPPPKKTPLLKSAMSTGDSDSSPVLGDILVYIPVVF